jgi:hypothetical protein
VTLTNTRGVTGYSILLPGGWRRIPVSHGTANAIASFLDEALAHLPVDVPSATVQPYRAELERQLSQAAKQARRQGGLDLYLPVERVHGVPVPASIVVSRGTLGMNGRTDVDSVVAELTTASQDSARVTVNSTAGVRFERAAGPDPARLVSCASHRVDYVLPVPGTAGDWLIIAFSVADANSLGAYFTRLMVELLDATISTFRWATG